MDTHKQDESEKWREFLAYVPNGAKHRDIAARLIYLLDREGWLAKRAATHGDPARLASIAHASYDSARRYLRGEHRPRPSSLKNIAEYWHVRPQWLSQGEPPMRPGQEPSHRPSEVNETALQRCLETVATAEKQAGETLDPEVKAQLVARLYRRTLAGHPPETQDVVAAIRILA